MVVLSKIYTRTGDKGDTALVDGTRVPKFNARVEAYGTADELNAVLGVTRLHAEADLDAALSRIQNDLFDLGADPRELNDLVGDPAYAETVAKLKAEVLDGWDPDAIRAKMQALGRDLAIQTAWTRNVQPPDSIRWTMKPEMSYLDDEQI